MFKLLLYLLSFFVILFCVSCNKEKLKAPQASFLVVDRTELITTFGQGSNSHKITDMWLYVNDEFKGVFPVGSVMPIISKVDNAEILLYPGIENNGISATRQPYKFYKSVKFVQNIEAGKTYTYTPYFEYVDGLTYPLKINESFETTGVQFLNAVNSYSIISDPNKTYGGTGKSLLMTMTDAAPYAEIQSTSISGIPLGSSPVYLELNYKCNQTFTIGVIGGSEVRPAITMNTKNEWNKIYLELNTPINTSPIYASYKVFIAAKKEAETPEIYLDNIKLVTY